MSFEDVGKLTVAQFINAACAGKPPDHSEWKFDSYEDFAEWRRDL